MGRTQRATRLQRVRAHRYFIQCCRFCLSQRCLLTFAMVVCFLRLLAACRAWFPRSYRLYVPSHRVGTYKNASERIRPDTILWSKNWRHLVHCDTIPASYYASDTSFRQDSSTMQQYFNGCGPGILWVRMGSVLTDDTLTDVSTFANDVLPQLQHPFVLLTTDGDKDVPSQIHGHERILNSRLCLAWYTQNYDGSVSIPKLHPLPIGFDLHTPRFGYWTNNLSENLEHMLDIRRRGLSATHTRLSTPLVPPWNPNTSQERQALEHTIECIVHKHEPSMTVSELWETYTHYRFAFAPRGNGIDTHRLWEMLFFGVIPIAKTSSIDQLFDGLPVLIVQEYADVCREHFLQDAWKRLQPLWPAPDHVFTIQHWIQKDHLSLN